MAKIYCMNHRERKLSPLMIHFGDSNLGGQYICALCSGVRVFNTGTIVELKGRFGFIDDGKQKIFFHMSNLGDVFWPAEGMQVSYEISFLEDDRIQAIDVQPISGGSHEYGS